MKKVRLILSSALLIATLLTLDACKKDEIKQNNNDTIKYTIPPPEFSTFTDPRDGQKYITVKIGNQWWFAQNLNYQTGNSWCYDDKPSNGNIYGRLYDWQSATTACPEGWHLPCETEWVALTNSLCGENCAGSKLKNTFGWDAPNGDATNSSGFSGLPGGLRDTTGAFLGLGKYGYWWLATEYDSSSAYTRTLYYTGGSMGRINIEKLYGLSVRCIKD